MKRVLIGSMGVGKSTFGAKLADALAVPFYPEPFEENRYLRRAYANPKLFSLPTQLEFANLLWDRDSYKTDGVFDSDILNSAFVYGQLYLDTESFSILESVVNIYKRSIPPADEYIYLKAPTDVIVKRINGRARDFESEVTSAFIQRLVDQIEYTFPTATVLDATDYAEVSAYLTNK